MGAPCGVAQGVIEKDLPRVAYTGGDVSGRCISNRGDPPLLQNPGNQTHGLVADGSDGRQQSDIHMVLQALAKDFRTIHLCCLTMAVIG